jgi:hypothetical protein
MPFVGWYYRKGTYVGSHYRRPPRRRWDSTTPPLFAAAAGLGVTAGDQRQRTDAVAPATRALLGTAAGTAPGSVPLDTVLTGDLFEARAV